MASLAGLGEACLNVVRVLCALKIFQMAVHAIGRGSLVASAHVTGGALQCGMRSRERKTSELQMIKGSSEPAIRAVALFTSDRKSRLNMARGRGGGVILRMAGIALR